MFHSSLENRILKNLRNAESILRSPCDKEKVEENFKLFKKILKEDNALLAYK